MNIIHNIIITEYFEQITVSIVPVYDDKATKTGDYISVRDGEREFMFLPNELYDIIHVSFEHTDFDENRIIIKLTTNNADNAVIYRYIDKDRDFIDIVTSNNSIKSIPTFVIKNVIDAYNFVEAEFNKIKSTIDDKYNKLKVIV